MADSSGLDAWFWVVLGGLDRPHSIATEVASDFLELRFFRTSLSCERFSPELSFLWLPFPMLEAFGSGLL
jgi:hypothetical protein